MSAQTLCSIHTLIPTSHACGGECVILSAKNAQLSRCFHFCPFWAVVGRVSLPLEFYCIFLHEQHAPGVFTITYGRRSRAFDGVHRFSHHWGHVPSFVALPIAVINLFKSSEYADKNFWGRNLSGRAYSRTRTLASSGTADEMPIFHKHHNWKGKHRPYLTEGK